MNACGIKFVHHTFPKGRWMVIRYLVVCDAPDPVVSVAGLCRLGYSVDFSHLTTTLMWRSHHRADVTRRFAALSTSWR